MLLNLLFINFILLNIIIIKNIETLALIHMCVIKVEALNKESVKYLMSTIEVILVWLTLTMKYRISFWWCGFMFLAIKLTS